MLHVFAVKSLAIRLDRSRDDERVIPGKLIAPNQIQRTIE